jgi:hypothetical protein
MGDNKSTAQQKKERRLRYRSSGSQTSAETTCLFLSDEGELETQQLIIKPRTPDFP